jgi:hypothetical protein
MSANLHQLYLDFCQLFAILLTDQFDLIEQLSDLALLLVHLLLV